MIAHAPDSGQVRVPLDAVLRIEFSEGMNRSSVRDWLGLAPWPGRLACRWENRTLVCRPEEGWQAGTTYAVLMGTQAADRRRNRLDRPLLFAFSTGDSLDVGEIRGRLHTRSLNAEGAPIFLFAWPADAPVPLGPAAALNPDPLRSLRISQTEKEGSFRLRFVPTDVPLLLAALYDRNGNRTFDENEDLWGFAERPVVCGDSAREANLYLVYADEPGDLNGAVTDSACTGYVAPGRWRARADSLKRILSGKDDAMGFPSAKGDTLPSAPGTEPTAAEAESLRAGLSRAEGHLETAMAESLRCGAAIWVSALRPDSTTAADARCAGAFKLAGLAPGRYTLSAFRDLNLDGVWQTGEPRGRFPHPIEVLPGRSVEGIEWEIAAASGDGSGR